MIGGPRAGHAAAGGLSATRWGLVLAGYLALSVVMTHPLFVRMSDHVLIAPIDNLLNTWILAWDFHTLPSEPLRLFDANIFYPTRNTLALSEHLLGDLPIFAPVMFLTQNPLLAANAVVFASFALSGITMFALVWSWTRSIGPSFVAGFIYAFAPPRFGQLGKWQLLSIQWAPLALLFLDRFLRSRRWRDGLLAAGFYVLQVLSSFYLGYALTFVMGAYLAYDVLTDRTTRRRDLLWRGLVCAALAGVLILPPSYPYFVMRQEFRLVSPSPESYTWASTDPARSFLSVTDYGVNIYQGLLARFQSARPWETWLFPGILPVALALVALASVVRASRPLPDARWNRHTVHAGLLIVLVSLVVSLGPVLVINGRATGIPMPYAFFSPWLAGFSALRVPARFALMAWVGLSILGGFGVQVLARALAGRLGRSPLARCFGEVGLPGGLLLLIAVECWFVPLPMDRIETGATVPAVYRWLAAQPKDGAMLEVPWTIPHERSIGPEWGAKYWLLERDLKWTRGHSGWLFDWMTRARYVYFSVYHWHPIVNGYSGYTAPMYEAIGGRLRGLPDAESIEYLGGLGVRRLIVHRDLLGHAEADRWQSANLAAVGLRGIGEFGQDVVYEIAPRRLAGPGGVIAYPMH